MAGKRSAGILLFRRGSGSAAAVEVLLGHMGGPYWEGRDSGAWSVPKGEHEPDESPLATARREFTEELGLPAPTGELIELGAIRQGSGKVVTVWAVEGNLDPSLVVPGTFDLEWPPRSGRLQSFPELDRAAWMPLQEARERLVGGQRAFIERLAAVLAVEAGQHPGHDRHKDQII